MQVIVLFFYEEKSQIFCQEKLVKHPKINEYLIEDSSPL